MTATPGPSAERFDKKAAYPDWAYRVCKEPTCNLWVWGLGSASPDELRYCAWHDGFHERDAEVERLTRALAEAERERDHLLSTFFATCPDNHEHGIWCGSNWAAMQHRAEWAGEALTRLREGVEALADEWSSGLRYASGPVIRGEGDCADRLRDLLREAE